MEGVVAEVARGCGRGGGVARGGRFVRGGGISRGEGVERGAGGGAAGGQRCGVFAHCRLFHQSQGLTFLRTYNTRFLPLINNPSSNLP